MSAIKLTAQAFFCIAILLHLVCAFLLFRRKLHKEYYFFFYFLLFNGLTGLVLELLYFLPVGKTVVYFYLYWVQAALADIFSFAVFYELFCGAFKPFAGLRDMAQVIFRWAAVALILIGVVVFFSSALPNFQRITIIVVNMERAICVMQCGLLLFLFMGSSYLGLSQKSIVFGVSLGFGLIAITNLVLLTVTSITGYYHPFFHWVLEFAQAVITAFSTGIWLLYVARPEPAREAVNVPVTSPLLRWNEVALALGHSGGRVAFLDRPEPFMPNVERMVEEVMKRDMFVDHH